MLPTLAACAICLLRTCLSLLEAGRAATGLTAGAERLQLAAAAACSNAADGAAPSRRGCTAGPNDDAQLTAGSVELVTRHPFPAAQAQRPRGLLPG